MAFLSATEGPNSESSVEYCVEVKVDQTCRLTDCRWSQRVSSWHCHDNGRPRAYICDGCKDSCQLSEI